MTQKEDHYYIEETLHGNTRAYEVLVDRYKSMVYTIAIRITKNREDAEEIAQDTFLKVFKALASFKGESKFSTWVYKIAYYGSLDYLKKKQRKVETVAVDISEVHNLSSLESVLEDIDRKERMEVLKAAVEKLSEKDSAIVTLYYFEELSIKEIAVITGLTTEVLKVRLFRSRKQLANILHHMLEPEIVENYERG
ncbi:MAG: sigma-70 family RNA polymerase sigma factor [Eudoraea sp.]|nr:sigma-70 family RNA polymerase sigma factor [Eudoraea sp.]